MEGTLARLLGKAGLPAAASVRRLSGRGLDNGYGGWSGRAVLSDPGWPFDIEMTSPQARFFQLYSPPGGGFIAAEPVGHANAALNEPEEEWTALGIQILEPGEKAVLDARIAVRPKPA